MNDNISNNGTITIKNEDIVIAVLVINTKEEYKKLFRRLNDLVEHCNFIGQRNGKTSYIRICEACGNIEDVLKNLVADLKAAGVSIVDLWIDCCGDFDGGYRLEDGYVKYFTEGDLAIRSADIDDLLAEIKRRFKLMKKKEA